MHVHQVASSSIAENSSGVGPTHQPKREENGLLEIARTETPNNPKKGFVGSLRSFYYKFVVSPLFLSVMLLVTLFVPKKLVKSHKHFLKNIPRACLQAFRRTMDLVGALFGLLITSLIFLLLPILIRLDSPGSSIFKQTRVGKNRRRNDRRVLQVDVPFERRTGDRRKQDFLGKPFTLYKFRSMRSDAENNTGAIWASDDDPRTTTIGKYLRPYHLDELPQLLNILRGEMSLIGPRPERPEFVGKLKEEIPGYEKRFTSKPGLTGLAQVSCPYDSTPEDVKNKLKYDLEYIKKSDIKTDFRIMWTTLKKITGFHDVKNGKPVQINAKDGKHNRNGKHGHSGKAQHP